MFFVCAALGRSETRRGTLGAELNDVDAHAVGELLLSHALLLAQGGQVFGEVHCPVVVDGHGTSVSEHGRPPKHVLT